MALYIGNKKIKLVMNNTSCSMKIIGGQSGTTDTTGIRLLSSEGYILTDSSELYLTVKEGN